MELLWSAWLAFPGAERSVCCDEKPLCLEALTLPSLPPSYPPHPTPCPVLSFSGYIIKKKKASLLQCNWRTINCTVSLSF